MRAVKMVCILLVLTGTVDCTLSKDHNLEGSCKRLENNEVASSSCSGDGVGDLYDALWEGSVDVAEQTLKEDFLQSMQGARLSAGRYASFLLQDILYLVNLTAMLGEMGDSVQEPDLREFFQNRYTSYQKYANVMLGGTKLKDASSIVPGPAISSYLQTYRDTMKSDPIYFAVAMLPCVTLWPYLAQHLDIINNTAYYEWKRDNSHSSAEAKYRPLLAKHAHRINRAKAMLLFRQQMEHEREFFRES